MSRRRKTIALPPPRPIVGVPYGRAARLLGMRPPLWCGGHCFRLLDDEVSWCVGCYRGVPRWAVIEGLWTQFLDRWCPRMFTALPAAVAS